MKKEKYIEERKSVSNGRMTFRVKLEYTNKGKTESYTESFSEKDYGSQKEALSAAKKDRDRVLNLMNNSLPIKATTSYSIGQIYIKYKELNPKTLATQTADDNYFYNYIANDFKNWSIEDISHVQVTLNLNKLINKSQNIIDRTHGMWKKIFDTALFLDSILIDPMRKVKKPKSSLIRIPRSQTTTVGDLLKLCDLLLLDGRGAIYKYNNMIKVYALKTIYYTGCRPSEAFALTKCDIDLSKGTVSINKAVGTTYTQERVLKATKNHNSIRIIPLNQEAIDLLKELLSFQKNDMLFADYNGNTMNLRSLTSQIGKIAKANNLNISMYKLRHLFSTNLITQQVDPRTVQELMGHSSTDMTLYYARSNEPLKKEAINHIKLN